MQEKIKGELIAEIKSLKIYAVFKKPKKSGKERIWINIRQDKPKKWKTTSTLSYVNGLDVKFEKR